MKCGELTVRVADSNGIPLEEYQNDGDLVQSELVSSAFIEVPAADQDQSFSIKYSFPPGYKFENARGIIVSLHFALSPVSDRGVESCIILDTKEGVFSKNHYQFEALSIEERPPSTKEKTNVDLGSIGIIEVRPWRVRNARLTGNAVPYAAEAQGPKSISEKLLKGKDLSHGIRGNAESLRQFKSTVLPSYQSDKETVEPFHSFRFYYRTKTALRSRGVLARTPEPEPELDPVEAELEQARRQVAELEQRLKKRTGDNIKQEPGRPVKREKTVPQKGPKTKVVIDLTEE